MVSISPFGKILIGVIIGFAAGFLLVKSCSKEGDLEQSISNLKTALKEEQTARESKELELIALNKAVDSLAAVKQKIKTKTIIRQREIDENISKDSANAISEYRRSLVENGWVSEGTPYLTFREITLGAKGLAELPSLKLQLNLCEQQSSIKDTVINNYKFIGKSYEESLRIQQLETLEWQKAYEREAAWYNENWIWLTLGVVVTGAIVLIAQ